MEKNFKLYRAEQIGSYLYHFTFETVELSDIFDHPEEVMRG